ncbi:DUF2188 domain-containing protein [Baaleninema simplex]|uniref:DUF2188 domain-containing protein n=1 Tax=Baaleninema simplex TaxID=2862350 RepID=UPI00034A5CF2|nr:DUF2188 domain-containing protein [Baaleninema simplex]
MLEQEKDQSKSDSIHHVIPNTSGGWAIKKEGESKEIKVFSNKEEAVKFAGVLSRQQDVKIIIHGRDGRIISTYTSDRGFRCARGLIIISPEFDDPLEEFGEYAHFKS